MSSIEPVTPSNPIATGKMLEEFSTFQPKNMDSGSIGYFGDSTEEIRESTPFDHGPMLSKEEVFKRIKSYNFDEVLNKSS